MTFSYEETSTSIRLQGLTQDVNRAENRIKDTLNKINYEHIEEQESILQKQLVSKPLLMLHSRCKIQLQQAFCNVKLH